MMITHATQRVLCDVLYMYNTCAPSCKPCNCSILHAKVRGSMPAAQVWLSNGQAVFNIKPMEHAAADLATLANFFVQGGVRYAKLPPGSYNATAAYGGDSLYVPGAAAATLVVVPDCVWQTIILPS